MYMPVIQLTWKMRWRSYKNGHRKILFIDAPFRNEDAQVAHRIMERYPDCHIDIVTLEVNVGIDRIRKVMETYCVDAHCTAILCDNLQFWVMGMIGALGQLKLNVPGDVSIQPNMWKIRAHR